GDQSCSRQTLPERAARLYLALGSWGLRPLKGIATAPLLSADGSARTASGYDAKSGMWCGNVPDVCVPPDPSYEKAGAALHVIRETFCTFPFADAEMTTHASMAVPTVAPGSSPRYAESTFIAGLMTAICRSSLQLAPGLLMAAPVLSGAGVGKGL